MYEFMDSQRIGDLPADVIERVPWRGTALNYEIGPAGLNWGNVTGGWMVGGIGGTVKHTIPVAITTSMLAWSMLAFPQV